MPAATSAVTHGKPVGEGTWFDAVIGQEQAVSQLRGCLERPVHAYLFVGPAGSGKRAAAYAFAAAMLGDARALRAAHPDVHTVDREGASISVGQAREISRLASLSPVEGARKVLVLDDFHLVADAAPALLKTIEEASASTTFIILAESIPKDLVTVASRCVVVEFRSLAAATIVEALKADGVDPVRAQTIVESSFGDLERARLLAGDDTVVARHQMWVDVPATLDGTGAAAAELALAVTGALDAASENLVQRQTEEFASLKSQVDQGAATNGALKSLEANHKRQQRRLRVDELRSGFATIAQELSRRMQLAPDERMVKRIAAALTSLQWASESVEFNPNESLLLHGLFVKLTEDLQ
jgi:DNA polymerase-3 subunit delta'